jgi:hypothetical protein
MEWFRTKNKNLGEELVKIMRKNILLMISYNLLNFSISKTLAHDRKYIRIS